MKHIIRGGAATLGGTALLLCNTNPATAHSSAPGEGSIWWAWHGEPWLWLLLVGASLAYARGVKLVWGQSGIGRGIQRYQATAYAMGMVTLVVALLSPLAHLAHESFALHMVQHLLLILVAPPLMVLGAPHLAYLWAMPLAWRRTLSHAWQRAHWLRRGWWVMTLPVSVWLLHSVALWVWHVPRFYEGALQNSWLHTVEHFSFFASALLFWWLLTQVGLRGPMGYGVALLYIFATMIQGTLLGALLTFAPRPWYASQTLINGAANELLGTLTPLQDQQLAGLIMWIPGGPIYLALFLWLTARWLRASDAVAQRRTHPIWAEMTQPTIERE